MKKFKLITVNGKVNVNGKDYANWEVLYLTM